MSAQLSPEQISSLPRALQSKPEVRGMTLPVYPNGPNKFRVPGRKQIYDLSISSDGKRIICTCIASLRQTCAHRYAVRYFLKQQRQERLSQNQKKEQ